MNIFGRNRLEQPPSQPAARSPSSGARIAHRAAASGTRQHGSAPAVADVPRTGLASPAPGAQRTRTARPGTEAQQPGPGLSHAVARLPRSAASIEIESDAKSGLTWLRWLYPTDDQVARPDDAGADRGRVVLLHANGAQVGENNVQVNVFEHHADDPKIDLVRLVKDPRVSASLARAEQMPGDPSARQEVHDALSKVRPRSRSDWTAEFAATGSAHLGWCAAALNGTVAEIESRRVQVGDDSYQENRIVRAICPKIDAAMLFTANPDLVDTLVDLAMSPGQEAAHVRFVAAMEEAVAATMAQSPAATSGHGTIHEPPPPGRTLRITRMDAVTVGSRVSQKNDHIHCVTSGRNVDRSIRKTTRAAAHEASERIRRDVEPHTPG